MALLQTGQTYTANELIKNYLNPENYMADPKTDGPTEVKSQFIYYVEAKNWQAITTLLHEKKLEITNKKGELFHEYQEVPVKIHVVAEKVYAVFKNYFVVAF